MKVKGIGIAKVTVEIDIRCAFCGGKINAIETEDNDYNRFVMVETCTFCNDKDRANEKR